jgi:cellulose 1,4-beta-cellobiosidase
VLNSGTGSQDLSQVTIRYYFTTDTQTALAGQINTASITEPAGPNYYAPVAGVTMTFTPMTTPTTTADTYVEFGFPAGTSLPANATLEVDVQFHAGDNQGTFNQANDYSYNGNAAAFTPSNTITVYASGTLVSGTEPM